MVLWVYGRTGVISGDGDDDCDLTQHGTQNTWQLICLCSTRTVVVNENLTTLFTKMIMVCYLNIPTQEKYTVYIIRIDIIAKYKFCK